MDPKVVQNPETDPRKLSSTQKQKNREAMKKNSDNQITYFNEKLHIQPKKKKNKKKGQ